MVPAFVPWLLFGIIVSILLGIYANEMYRNSKKVEGGPKDCLYNSWTTWTGCEDQNCVGIGIRTRTIARQSSGGVECAAADLIETSSCYYILNCDASACQYTDWSTWSDCPVSCFDGINCNNIPDQIRVRSVLRAALPGGEPCDWTSLLEKRQCQQTDCAPNVACTASGDNPSRDCEPCPQAACTVSGFPIFSMCTRSILTSASGTGKPCDATQLIYSYSCPLPECTQQCIENDIQAFTRCNVPCGPGLKVSENPCPFASVSNCNLGDCSTGGMAFSASNFIVPISYLSGGSNLLSTESYDFLVEALARCASREDCVGVLSVTGQTGYFLLATLSINGTYVAALSGDLYTYSNVAPCVAPNWDMVNATCLLLCDTDQFYSPVRGLVFPFENGSLSCPITPEVLQNSGVCGLSSETLMAPTYFTGVIPHQAFIMAGQIYTFSVIMSEPNIFASFSVGPIAADSDLYTFTGNVLEATNDQVVIDVTFAQVGLFGPQFIATQGTPPVLPPELVQSSVLFGQEFFSEQSTNTKSISDGGDWYTLTCPASQNCEYQSWSDAPVWGICNAPCGFGVGFRQRFRAILQNAVFLGDQCEVFLQTDTAACNSDVDLTIADYMFCSGGTNIQFTSEIGCQKYCSQSGTNCLSYQFLENSHSTNPELFLSYSAVPLTSLSLVGLGVANLSDVYTGYAQGFQQKIYGWIRNPAALGIVGATSLSPTQSVNFSCSATIYSDLLAYYLTEENNLYCSYTAFLNNEQTSTAPAYEPCNPGYELSISNLAICSRTSEYYCAQGKLSGSSCFPVDEDNEILQEYFLGLVNQQSSSLYSDGILVKESLSANYFFAFGQKGLGNPDFYEPDPAPGPFGDYAFTSQSNLDMGTCTIFSSRLDSRLVQNTCVPLGSISEASKNVDVQCGGPTDCAVSDWTTVTECFSCVTPIASYEVRTRTIIRQAFEGGIPCSRFPLREVSQCQGPPCQPEFGACIYEPFPMSSSFNPEAAKTLPPFRPFINDWNSLTTFAWSQNPLFPYIASNSNYTDLALSLNSACVVPEPPSCISSLTFLGGSFSVVAGAFSLTQNGWIQSACTPIPSITSCILERANNFSDRASLLTGSWVYGPDWRVVSACPWLSQTCAWSACSSCKNAQNSQTQIVVSNLLYGEPTFCAPRIVLTQNCPNDDSIPVCVSSLTCPIGCDNSPCNSLTGKGVCSLTGEIAAYQCVCFNGNTSIDCGFDCPTYNGITCGGHGRCQDGVCFCDPGWSGEACDQGGSSLLGLMESILRTTTMNLLVTQNISGLQQTVPVTFTNLLPCDEQSNPYCTEPTYDTSTVVDIVPFFDPSTTPVSMNICVNSVQSSVGDIGKGQYVPAHYMPLENPLPCNLVTNFPGSGLFYDIPAVFTSHSAVPPALRGLRFFLSCGLEKRVFVKGTTTFSVRNPCQYADTCEFGDEADKLFSLLNFEDDYRDYCDQFEFNIL